PLFGTFALAWVAHNWKILFIGFAGELSPGLRIHIISDSYVNITDLLFWPLGYAFIFLATYPFLSVIVTALWEWSNPIKRWIVNKVNKIETVSRAEFNEMISRYDIEVNKLESSRQDKEIKLRAIRDELEKTQKELTDKTILEDTTEERVRNELQTKIDIQESEIVDLRKQLKELNTSFSDEKISADKELSSNNHRKISFSTDTGHMQVGLTNEEINFLINLFHFNQRLVAEQEIQKMLGRNVNSTELFIKNLMSKMLIDRNAHREVQLTDAGLRLADKLTKERKIQSIPESIPKNKNSHQTQKAK
ncbi:MAG: hypothetical protein NWF06_00125, partial [Candidatus Bathyarchaeota archaeon]|nr:hypothetical protein [Candidatus Bathyarchaeum sp.]